MCCVPIYSHGVTLPHESSTNILINTYIYNVKDSTEVKFYLYSITLLKQRVVCVCVCVRASILVNNGVWSTFTHVYVDGCIESRHQSPS